MGANYRYSLASSRLTGVPAHFDQLRQMLNAPNDYWKAQTPLDSRPLTRFEIDETAGAMTALDLADGVTPFQVQTLLVLMAARMPGISLRLQIDGGGDAPRSLRLVHGKLEAGRGPDDALEWEEIPHHSSLIGRK